MKKDSGKESLNYIGFISKPYGFKGDLLLAFENTGAVDFEFLKFIFIELEGKPVPFFIEEIKLNGNNVIAKLEDVSTEADAKKLSGKKLFIESTGAVAFEPEISWHDLTGYMVFDAVCGKLGILEKVEEYPQQFIGHCTVNGTEVLFPLTEDLIEEINDAKKELHLHLPDGLLDVYLNE